MTRNRVRLTNSIRSDQTASRKPTMTSSLSPKIRVAALPLAISKATSGMRVSWTVRSPAQSAARGFTLIELLLALALLLMLVGAVVFSFSTLLRGRQLEEGATQLESLLRFARAHAANTGHRVQILFVGDADSDGPAATIRVAWEPDP